jgi:hypothetical protein
MSKTEALVAAGLVGVAGLTTTLWCVDASPPHGMHSCVRKWLCSGSTVRLCRLKRPVHKAPQLYYGRGGVIADVLPQCRLLLQPYVPTPWAVNRHVQTIVGRTSRCWFAAPHSHSCGHICQCSLAVMRRASINGNYRRQMLQGDDGATLALDWFDHCDDRLYGADNTPILLVLHGINGASQGPLATAWKFTPGVRCPEMAVVRHSSLLASSNSCVGLIELAARRRISRGPGSICPPPTTSTA